MIYLKRILASFRKYSHFPDALQIIVEVKINYPKVKIFVNATIFLEYSPTNTSLYAYIKEYV